MNESESGMSSRERRCLVLSSVNSGDPDLTVSLILLLLPILRLVSQLLGD